MCQLSEPYCCSQMGSAENSHYNYTPTISCHLMVLDIPGRTVVPARLFPAVISSQVLRSTRCSTWRKDMGIEADAHGIAAHVGSPRCNHYTAWQSLPGSELLDIVQSAAASALGCQRSEIGTDTVLVCPACFGADPGQ